MDLAFRINTTDMINSNVQSPYKALIFPDRIQVLSKAHGPTISSYVYLDADPDFSIPISKHFLLLK